MSRKLIIVAFLFIAFIALYYTISVDKPVTQEKITFNTDKKEESIPPNSSQIIVSNKIDDNSLNNSSVESSSTELKGGRNLVILIDFSGSTGLTIVGGTDSRISLIDANAISVVRNIEPDSNVGIVAFSGITKQTNLLFMGTEKNKTDLENFIKEIGPKEGDNPTDLDKGLHKADELLNSANGTKEIIIISDGFMDPKGLAQTKNTVLELTKKDIKIQFVQILFSEEKRIPSDNYDILAKAVNTDVVLLYPDERLGPEHV